MVKASPDASLISSRIEEGMIGVKAVRDRKECHKIMTDFNINLGEAETLHMGRQFKALIATDDRNAIQACRLLRLPFTSSLAILIRLKQKRILSREMAAAKLDELARYGRFDPTIIKDVRKKLEE